MSGNDSFAKLLSHFDGVNGGTTFTDSSASARTITKNGTVTTSTGQIKFGTAAALFDGTTGYLTCADSSDFKPAGDFTIDCWAYITSLASTNTLFGKYSAGGFTPYAIRVTTTGAVQLLTSSNGSTFDLAISSSAGVVTTNAWNHFALVRNGNTWTVYVNGTAVLTGSSSNTPMQTTDLFCIGARNAGTPDSFVVGYIDEFRFSLGIARWTTAFTPPTQQYGTDYSLSVSAGSYALSGVALTMKRGLHLIPATGSYALTGVATALRKGFYLIPATGSYAVTGIALVVAHAVAAANKFKRRLVQPILYKLRGTTPTLED